MPPQSPWVILSGQNHARGTFHAADLRCRQLTGLPVKRASICVGRLLNAYLGSEVDVDPAIRDTLPPLGDCAPWQLQESMIRLLNSHTASPGSARWVLRSLAELAPLLDWKIVLAHARFPDPRVG